MLGDFRVAVDDRPLAATDWQGSKACDLFKCLLSRPERRLPCAAAIDLLWPERSAIEGAADLRAALTALDRTLAPAHVIDATGDVLSLRPEDVWVDAEAFEDLARRARESSSPRELLERAHALYVGHFLPHETSVEWIAQRREALKRNWLEVELHLARVRADDGELDAAAAPLRNVLSVDPRHRLAAEELMRILPRTDTTGPPRLPTGTVTFMFTDVEKSTRMWEADANAMRRALARHERLIHTAAAQFGGVVVRPRGEGDSHFVVFTQATAAAAAAHALQLALESEPWPTSAPLRVRIALHTGEADVREGDYYGSAVNRCARLRAAAHGGQTLLSGITAELVGNALPAGAELVDLGIHRLKDISRPEHVFELRTVGARTSTAALGYSTGRSNNLPVQLTSFLGRVQELRLLRQLLLRSDVRLVTLTGPGGIGKTRLAVEAASSLQEQFADGVVFVALADVRDPELVLSSIGSNLGTVEAADRSHLDQLREALWNKEVLLVLDNFEHIIAAAPRVAQLLSECPTIKLLVTSREVLHVGGEYDVPVAPLALQTEAVQLFLERARAVKPAFGVSPETAGVITSICRALEGLPLAIELAAARTRHMSAFALLDRLERRLDVLVGGAQDLPQRQRALRNTLAWSYELLDDREQRVIRQVGVFVGGIASSAAEAVCELGPAATLDVLSALIDKSLLSIDDVSIRAPDADQRYRMYESVREYVLERLEELDEADAVRSRHAAYFLRLAETAEPLLRGPDQREWLDRLALEHGNLRSALGWADSTGAIQLSLRFGAALARFWWRTGHLSEGQRWLERALARDTGGNSETRARALTAAGVIAWWRGESVLAAARLDESIDLHKRIGNTWGTAYALLYRGSVSFHGTDYAAAAGLYSHSLELFRSVDDQWGIGAALNNLGEIARLQADYGPARSFYEQSLDLARGQGDTQNVAVALLNLGLVAIASHDPDRAGDLFAESLRPVREHASGLVADCLDGLAAVASMRGNHERAVRIFAAATVLRERIGVQRGASEDAEYRSALERARAQLEEGTFSRASRVGREMYLDAATTDALNGATEPRFSIS